jgi:hypothetical protein
MREELELALIQDFPDLYWQHELSPSETSMCFGFEVGDGWEPLIRELSEKIYSLVQKYNSTLETEDYKFAVIQVKEKFGGLRYYTNWHIEEIQNIINEYEGRSYSTCEECGKPGEASGKNWIVTLCPDHEKRREERRWEYK